MSAFAYVAKYSPSTGKFTGRSKYWEIDATAKWVEYSLDIVDMNKLLMVSNFNDKMDLLAALDVAEQRRKRMYDHPNFDLKEATDWFRLVKDRPKLSISNKKKQDVVKKKKRK